MSRHTIYTDLSDLQPRLSKRAAKALDYLTAIGMGLALAVLLVYQLSK